MTESDEGPKRSTWIRSLHPRLSGLMLRLTSVPQTTTAFGSGAEGERRAAASIIERAGPDVLFLLNRSIGPGRRDDDIDLLAVGPGGVYVVDVKRYVRSTIQVRRIGGVFMPRREQLFVKGRDQTSLLESLRRQVEAVRTTLADHPGSEETPVAAAFCFVDARLPRRAQSIDGVPLLDVNGVAQLVSTAGDLTGDQQLGVHAHLATRLPPAG